MKKFLTLGITCVILAGIFVPSGVVFGATPVNQAYISCVSSNPLGSNQISVCSKQHPDPTNKNFQTCLSNAGVNASAMSKCATDNPDLSNGTPQTGNCNQNGVITATTEENCSGSWSAQNAPIGTCNLNGTNQQMSEANCTEAGGNWSAPSTAKADTGGGCGITTFWTLDCVLAIIKYIAYFFLQIMSWVLWLAGSLLDFVLNATIIQMSARVTNMTGINVAWKVTRDILNMAFIFLLLYNAIQVIINRVSIGDIQKVVVGIVTTALLINFSMFFTKVIIDASNIATVGFYSSIQDAGKQTALSNGGVTSTIQKGISGAFVNALHVNGFFSSKGVDDLGGTNGKSDNSSLIIISIAGSILFAILAFIFFAVSMMFIIRFLVLVFLLIVSPVGFIGFGLPQLKATQKKWWDTLIAQCLFAPIYMILTWITFTLISSPGFLDIANNGAGQQATWSSVIVGGDGSGMGLMLNFVLVIGLAILSLTVSKTYASKGAGIVGTATGKLTAFAGGAVMGGAAWAGRTSVGRIGKMTADNATLQEAAAKKTGFTGATARLALYASKKARSGSFDVRNATVPTNAVGDLIEGTVGRTKAGKALGLNDVNIPGIEVGSPLTKFAGTGTGGTKGFKEAREESAKRVHDREAAAASELALAKAKKDVITGAKTGATPAEIDAMEKALAKLSTKETETLVASNRELLESQNFANKISVQQLEALNKSDQFSEAEKGGFKDQRFAEIKAINDSAGLAALAVPVATRTPDQVEAAKRVETARKRTKALSDSEIEMIDPAYLKDPEFVSQLKQSQVDSINKSNKFTTTQKNDLREERMKPLMTALTTGNIASIQSLIRKVDHKTLAGYMSVPGRGGINIAMDPAVLPTYNPNTLKRMAQEMNPGDIQTLRTAILAGGNPATITWLRDPDKGGIDFA